MTWEGPLFSTGSFMLSSGCKRLAILVCSIAHGRGIPSVCTGQEKESARIRFYKPLNSTSSLCFEPSLPALCCKASILDFGGQLLEEGQSLALLSLYLSTKIPEENFSGKQEL